MSKIVRVGVTFPPKLLKELDEAILKMRYKNRSKAIQDAVRLLISEHEWLKKEKGVKAGILLLLYDHEVRDLTNALLDVQHHHLDLILSTMHIHLNERDCLEAIALKGKASDIHRLYDELTSKRGVKMVRAFLTET